MIISSIIPCTNQVSLYLTRLCLPLYSPALSTLLQTNVISLDLPSSISDKTTPQILSSRELPLQSRQLLPFGFVLELFGPGHERSHNATPLQSPFVPINAWSIVP